MEKVIIYVICILSVLSGCAGSKNRQPESINLKIPVLKSFEKQFDDYFETIEKKGELAVINLCRITALTKYVDFDNDTIIYYEDLSGPTATIGVVNYRGEIYKSGNHQFHAFGKYNISTAAINAPAIKNPFSQKENLYKVVLEDSFTGTDFKKIIETIKKGNQEKVFQLGKLREFTGSRNYGNTLVIAIKVGGIYTFKTYKNFSFKLKGSVIIEPLEIESIGE